MCYFTGHTVSYKAGTLFTTGFWEQHWDKSAMGLMKDKEISYPMILGMVGMGQNFSRKKKLCG
ncbi:hypothetical protein D3H65_03570 [Paraflavitalea soli]|uniref:Uncharacterized protein n=1 Tax=Paraflavitalea soli TaxID=2315862 RepID=A0A3B7MFK0_9BACT|nr:hypothetical protein D3H65_03570 [Paraflavitalea soli]